MKKFTSLLLTVLTLLAALTLSGCSAKEETAMIVNDVKIPQGVLNYYINYGKDYLASYGIDVTDPDTGAQYLSMIEEQGVDIVTQIAVIRSLATDNGLTVDKTALAENLATEKAYFTDDDAWQEWLTSYELSESDVEWILEYQLLAEALYEKVNEDITLTDDEVAEIYNADPTKYDTYRFANIVIAPEDTDDDASWDAALQTAQSVIAQLNDGSASFEDLAAQYNTDSTSSNGGDLGSYVTKDNSPYVAEFNDAAFALNEIDDYTAEPVRSDYGYHIIKLLDKTTGVGEARSAIIEDQRGEERIANYNSIVEEALESATITQDYVRQYAVTDDGTTDDTADSTDTTGTTDTTGSTTQSSGN
jgi:peptidyl-prolyl cis-trans isomerase C